MNTALNSFVMLSAAALGLLSIFAAAVAVAGSVLYRSTLLRKEVATRRFLGARRSNIARMFLSENVLGIAAGILIGSVALTVTGSLRNPGSWTVVLSSATFLTLAGSIGGWIAARRATRTRSDSRGQ